MGRAGKASLRSPSYWAEEEKGKNNSGGSGEEPGECHGRGPLPEPTLHSLSNLLGIPPPLPLRAPNKERKGGSIQQTYTVASKQQFDFVPGGQGAIDKS